MPKQKVYKNNKNMYYIKINCIFNNQGAWCTNKKIKRSLFGLGARVCCEVNDKKCELKERKNIKTAPPPPSL